MSETSSLQTANGSDAKHEGARSPLAFVVDEEASIRQFVSLLLQGAGIDTLEFADGAAFRSAKIGRSPDLVFLNVGTDTQDAEQSIDMLALSGYSGAVQLMSGKGASVLDTVQQAGLKSKLRMLPALSKPFETSAIQKMLSDQRLGHSQQAPTVRVSLAEALTHEWVEFWYQPKIDLKKKQLAGAEAFARVNHPQHGILPPATFTPGADAASLEQLGERALVGALKSGLNLSRLGVNLRIAVNMPLSALAKLPIGDIVRSHRPQVDNWPGLIIDLTEEQVITEITLANEQAKKLAEHNVKLAIDDFGRGYSALSRLKEVPFAEMKLDPRFVVGCGSDKAHAPVCKNVIDLAHSFGSLAVGIGLENASDAQALVAMGCDLGQGFLLGQPMPEERFIALLKQRVSVRQASAPTEASGAAA